MPCDHDTLDTTRIIERYLKGELSPQEEQEWEEHYFQCDECFKALESTAQIVQYIRKESIHRRKHVPLDLRLRWTYGVFRERLRPIPSWRPALAAAVAVILVGIPATVGWLRVASLRQEVKELRRPDPAYLSFVMEETVRGEEPSVVIPAGAGRFLLQFNLLIPENQTTILKATIRDMEGNQVWTGTGLEAHGRYGSYAIACHGSFFAPGDYELCVEELLDTDKTVTNRFTFPFRIDDRETAPEAQ